MEEMYERTGHMGDLLFACKLEILPEKEQNSFICLTPFEEI